MPFTSGVFVNVSGATSAATSQVIQSATWNNIHGDYSTAFNQLMGQMITTPSIRNIAWMNGGMEVWQRGTSIAVAASSTLYTADRWYLATDTGEASVVSQQTGLVDESQFCARVQRNSGQTGTGVMRFAFPLSLEEIVLLRGNIANLSFRIRAGANWSPASGTLTYTLYIGTGAAAKRNATPYTGESSAIASTVNLTTTTVLVTASSASVIPVATTQAEIQFSWTPVGTASTNDYFEIDDLQLEPSLSANTYTITSYDRIPFETMLRACKRFYQKTFAYSVSPAAGAGLGDSLQVYAQAAETFGYFWQYQVELRSNTPSFTKHNPVTATSSNWYNIVTSATSSATFFIQASTINSKGVMIIASASVTAIAQTMAIHAEVSAGI